MWFMLIMFGVMYMLFPEVRELVSDFVKLFSG